jgi:dTMP kinase
MLGGVARFIVFEGGEASGKSTQSIRLARRLDALHTREPGGTAVGAALRELLLDARTTGLDDRAEALLMVADRAQHVAEVVRPALARGAWVVSDRYVPSSLAYQGAARGLGVEAIEQLSEWATDGLQPDLVLVLDVPDDVTAKRRSGGDRMEREAERFHTAVRVAYRDLAGPRDWVVVDGSGDVDAVAAKVWAVVEQRLAP